MQNYLIFHLYGSLASWGSIAVGGVRPSYRHPSKSAIMGLLAAALGIKRDEEDRLQALQKSLGFAVRLETEGRLMLDYHTAQVPARQALKNHPHCTRRDELAVSDLETILSGREYYCDASYTVALWSRHQETSLFDLKNKLEHPIFVLYLGRKSCPMSLPVSPYLCEAQTIEAALDKYDAEPTSQERREMLSKLINKEDEIHLYTDIDEYINDSTDSRYRHIENRRDQLLNRQHWQYSEREEMHIMLNRRRE